MAGQAGADIKLQAGDTLRVYSRSDLSELLDTVSVVGQVINPGTYPYEPRDACERPFEGCVWPYHQGLSILSGNLSL